MRRNLCIYPVCLIYTLLWVLIADRCSDIEGDTMGKLAGMFGRTVVSAQLQVVLVIAGLVLVVIAILGSGDYVKVVIPTLKPWARLLLAGIGVVVFLLAFIPGAISSPSSSVRAASTPSTPQHTKSANPTDSPTPTSVQTSVTITSPPNGARLPDSTFGASGTAQNVSAGYSLWLVIKPPTYYKWYPVARLAVVNGSWKIQMNKICPAGGRQNLRVLLVPNSADARLTTYVSRRSGTHDPGIGNMPTQAIPEAITRIYVAHVQRCGS